MKAIEDKGVGGGRRRGGGGGGGEEGGGRGGGRISQACLKTQIRNLAGKFEKIK